MSIEALRNLNSSFNNRKHTIVLQKRLIKELGKLEKTLYWSELDKETNPLQDDRYINLTSLRALSTTIIERLEEEDAEDFINLHKLYDIHESHHLVPYSKIID